MNEGAGYHHSSGQMGNGLAPYGNAETQIQRNLADGQTPGAFRLNLPVNGVGHGHHSLKRKGVQKVHTTALTSGSSNIMNVRQQQTGSGSGHQPVQQLEQADMFHSASNANNN